MPEHIPPPEPGPDSHSAPALEPGPDPGLFGPDSVTWHLHSDPMMWVAGVRALYLQALHPRAVRGVMENSDFRKDAWGRLMRTAGFVGTTTYGTTEVAEKAGARVRKIHTMLKATDPETGERYGVDDPELLLWVHCAEIDSYLHVVAPLGHPPHRRPGRPLRREHRQSARLVGLDPDDVPASTAALAAYFANVRARTRRRRRGARTSTTSCSARPPTRCSSRRAPCCGGAWRTSRTPRCRRTPTSCTAGPPRRPPR